MEIFRKHASVTAKELIVGDLVLAPGVSVWLATSTLSLLQPINPKIINSDNAPIFLAITLIYAGAMRRDRAAMSKRQNRINYCQMQTAASRNINRKQFLKIIPIS